MAMIAVKVGELAKPLETHRIKKGTTLGAFIEKLGDVSMSEVRVNGAVKGAKSALRAGDIVTIIGHVSGGR